MNKDNLKIYYGILVESIIIATISLGLSCIFFIGLVNADHMYQQTGSDTWGIMIIVLLCVVANSIIVTIGVYFCVLKKFKKNSINFIKFTCKLIISDVVYVVLMLVVFPTFYRIFESSISGSEWGSDLLLAIIQGSVLIVACVWILVLGILVVCERARK